MNRWLETLRELAYGAAALYLLGAAAFAFRLVLSRPLPEALDLGWLTNRWGLAAAYLAASAAALLALHFALKLWDNAARRRRFFHEGSQGPIAVSPYAVRDFVRGLLAGEDALVEARIRLEHAADGALRLTVSAGLTPEAGVVETANRVQTTLKEQVETRLGVRVSEVAFHAHRIAAPPTRAGGDAPALPGRKNRDELQEEGSP